MKHPHRLFLGTLTGVGDRLTTSREIQVGGGIRHTRRRHDHRQRLEVSSPQPYFLSEFSHGSRLGVLTNDIAHTRRNLKHLALKGRAVLLYENH